MIFRNDDVSVNTNVSRMVDGYSVIRELFPEADIWSAVSLFGRKNKIGSVYPSVPFKDKEQKWFYGVDGFVTMKHDLKHKVVSHGLLHFDHSKASYDTQELSILTSCNFLKANIFVPPFNRYNLDTELVCKENSIFLAGKDEKWINLESNKFNPSHKYWYYHSWRLDADKLREILSAKHSFELGQF